MQLFHVAAAVRFLLDKAPFVYYTDGATWTDVFLFSPSRDA